jgi:hypothetical protein
MKSVRQISVENKRVFVRVDYNLPMDDQGNITDDNRILATLDMIQYLRENKAKIILASHLGRPDGTPDDRFSLSAGCPAPVRTAQHRGSVCGGLHRPCGGSPGRCPGGRADSHAGEFEVSQRGKDRTILNSPDPWPLSARSM